MTSAELYQWITDPSSLTKASLSELKQLVADYPCFHAVRMLYLKNLALLNDVRLNRELKKMAVYIPDRRQLFLLLDDKRQIQPQKATIATEKISPDTDDSPKETIKPTVNHSKKENPSVAVAASDYVRWLEEHAVDLPTDVKEKNQFKHQEIIDAVIANGLNIAAVAPSNVITENVVEKKPTLEKKPTSDVSENMSLDESYFTETLARVYISQKRYDKALEIFRVLNLKYPEKSIYFAAQIQSIEKIINN